MDKVSLAIMVKNEESTIIKTLSSCINYIDNLYIYDTGSTDTTIKLITDFCDQNSIKLHLLCGEFESYSVSRNKLLDFIESFLTPQKDYYLILDANDELRIGDDFKGFNDLFNSTNENHKVIMGNSYWKNGFNIICHLKILFIKVGCKVRYEGSIHEYLKLNGEILDDTQIKRVDSSIINIFQNRFIDEMRSLERAKTDIKLLKADIKNNVYPGRNTYLIGRTYFNTENMDKALKYFKKGIDFIGLITKEEKFQCHYYSAIIKKQRNDANWILHVFDAYELMPDKIENILFLCMYLSVTERWLSLYTYSKKAIKLAQKFDYKLSTCVLYNDTDYKLYCWYYHVMSAYHLDKFKQAYSSLQILDKHVKEYGDDIDDFFGDFKESYVMFKNIFMPFDFDCDEFIVLFGGYGYGKWNAKSINGKNGLGGAETVIINVANILKNHQLKNSQFNKNNNCDVIVFCDTDENICYNGVYYLKLELYDIFVTCRKIRTLFVFRFIDFIRYYDNIDKVVLVLEDYAPVGHVLQINHKLKSIICKTEWHKSILLELHPTLAKFRHKIRIINNAINIDRFLNNTINNNIVKEKWRFIYSSCMTRGLNNLLEMWPTIKKIIPEATLHLFVAYECPFYKPEHDIEGIIEKIKVLETTHDVVRHDRVPQDELAIEIMKSDIWLHPTLCPETYCITALEMQMGKVLCISTKMGGVVESVSDRGILVDYDGKDHQVYLDIIRDLKDGKINKDDYIKRGYEWAKNQDWSIIGEKFVNLC